MCRARSLPFAVNRWGVSLEAASSNCGFSRAFGIISKMNWALRRMFGESRGHVGMASKRGKLRKDLAFVNTAESRTEDWARLV